MTIPAPQPASKLSHTQHNILNLLVEGKSLKHDIGSYRSTWYLMPDKTKVPTATANALQKRRLIVSDGIGAWIISDAGRAALDAANGVSVLAQSAAAVASYEVAADALSPPLDSIDWIEVSDYVRIAAHDGRKLEGFVEAINVNVQYALVRTGAYVEWFSIDETYLVFKAKALETVVASV